MLPNVVCSKDMENVQNRILAQPLSNFYGEYRWQKRVGKISKALKNRIAFLYCRQTVPTVYHLFWWTGTLNRWNVRGRTLRSRVCINTAITRSNLLDNLCESHLGNVPVWGMIRKLRRVFNINNFIKHMHCVWYYYSILTSILNWMCFEQKAIRPPVI